MRKEAVGGKDEEIPYQTMEELFAMPQDFNLVLDIICQSSEEKPHGQTCRERSLLC
jgi:hypothetical protein